MVLMVLPYSVVSYKMKEDQESRVVTSKPIHFGKPFDETTEGSSLSSYSLPSEKFKPSKELFLIPSKEYEKLNDYRLYQQALQPFTRPSDFQPQEIPENVYKDLFMLNAHSPNINNEPNQSTSKESSEENSGINEYEKRNLVAKHKPNDLNAIYIDFQRAKNADQKEYNLIEEKRPLQKHRQDNVDHFYEDPLQYYNSAAPKFKMTGHRSNPYSGLHEMEFSPTDLSAHYIDNILEDNYWYQRHKSQRESPKSTRKHRSQYNKESMRHPKEGGEAVHYGKRKKNKRQKSREGPCRNYSRM